MSTGKPTPPHAPGETHTSVVTLRLIALLCLLLTVPEASWAATSGETYWQALREVWFGPYGAIFGVVGFVAVLFIAGRFGIGAGVGGLVMLVVFFLIPALVVGIQNWGKTASIILAAPWA
jgi:hypothetical protein